MAMYVGYYQCDLAFGCRVVYIPFSSGSYKDMFYRGLVALAESEKNTYVRLKSLQAPEVILEAHRKRCIPPTRDILDQYVQWPEEGSVFFYNPEDPWHVYCVGMTKNYVHLQLSRWHEGTIGPPLRVFEDAKDVTAMISKDPGLVLLHVPREKGPGLYFLLFKDRVISLNTGSPTLTQMHLGRLYELLRDEDYREGRVNDSLALLIDPMLRLGLDRWMESTTEVSTTLRGEICDKCFLPDTQEDVPASYLDHINHCLKMFFR